jgi:hypothetical protein
MVREEETAVLKEEEKELKQRTKDLEGIKGDLVT